MSLMVLIMTNKVTRQKSYQKDGAKLYLVPTPIGNLEDMTFRSIQVLRDVDIIASEDTRNTQKLLNHFEITTKQTSLHEHNYKEKIPMLLTMLDEGKSIAQVSDAGMPSISDPGHELVQACIQHNIDVISLPGATAGVTSLIASGLAVQPFVFYGFLPRKKNEIKKVLAPYEHLDVTFIFYESPHRISKTLQSLSEILDEHTPCCIARELTKIHEEYIRGTLQTVAQDIQQTSIKGEICLLVEHSASVTTSNLNKELPLYDQVHYLMDEQGLKSKEAIKEVAKQNGLKKQVVYQAYHQIT